MAKKSITDERCPCGSEKNYAACCGLLHGGAAAAHAEALMRSRYCAYVRNDTDYILRSWHSSTRPAADAFSAEPAQWIGLQIKRHEPIDATHARVEFVARYKINGRAHSLHEISRFVCEQGHWFYVDGEIK